MLSSTTTPTTLVAGLTGSIGSGKSQAAEIFKKCGAQIIDADVLAREVVAPGSPALGEIKELFGAQYVLPNGELDRKALGRLVFSRGELITPLEDILHPRIRKLYLERLEAAKAQTPPPGIVMYVVPLLFESRFSHPEFDAIIVVSAPRATCIERVVNRDNCAPVLAQKKYDVQIPMEEKESRADYVIRNEGTLEQLESQTRSVYEALLALRK